jgi:transposase
VAQIHQRKYLERPAGIIEKRTYQVGFNINLDQVEQQMELLGWRIYATNHPKKELSIADAVVAYRQEYLIEHCFGRLKGQQLNQQQKEFWLILKKLQLLSLLLGQKYIEN